MMIIESCLKDEHVFMRASPSETSFMYMYFTLLSNLHLTLTFDKFEVNVLWELNVAPT